MSIPPSLWQRTLADFQHAVETRSTPGCGAAAALGACLGLSLVLKGLRLTADKRQNDAESAALIDRGDSLYHRLAAAVDDDANAFAEWLEAKRLAEDSEPARRDKRQRMAAAQQASVTVPLEAAARCEEGLALAGESIDETAPVLESDTAAGALMLKSGLEALLIGVESNLEGLEDLARRDTERRCETLRQSASAHCRRLGLET